MDPTPPDAYAGAQLRDGEVSTGTTIMAVSYAGGVVMGADSRVSTHDHAAGVAHGHDCGSCRDLAVP